MKKGYILPVIVASLLISCERLSEFTKFNLIYDETVVIPSSTGLNLPLNLFTPDIETDSESEFAINDTRKDLIEEITLTTLDLSLNSPSNGDFSFLESIAIFVSADSLPEVRVAWYEDVPNDQGKFLSLETTDTDLQEYIKSDQFSLRVNTVTDEIISSDHEIKIHSVFYVDARILGY